MPDGQPRPTTLWEWFTFACIFGVCFFLLALLRGAFLVAARTIQDNHDKARLAALVAKREARLHARSQQGAADTARKREPPKQIAVPRRQQPTQQGKSRAAKKAD